MRFRWIVIWHVDAEPPRVLPFEEEADARETFKRLCVNWTGVLLCQVVLDAGRPGLEP